MLDFECEYRSQCEADEAKNKFADRKKENKCKQGCGKRLAYYIGSLNERIDWSKIDRRSV